jgi:hypothetical protein
METIEIALKIDTRRRELLLRLVSVQVSNPHIYLSNPELWAKISRVDLTPMTKQCKYDQFVYRASDQNPTADLDYYERTYGKDRRTCMLMKELNDGEVLTRVEWVQIHQDPATRNSTLI